METLRLKSRPPVEDRIENWDDDDFNLDHDDLAFASRSVSSATNPPTRRDSYSSHLSFRSDLDSIHAEEERHVHIPGDDEKSTLEAIAAAAKAGIPIPKNVPSSALLGGTIKRLGGGKKIKKIIQDDWETDLELPDPGQALRLKAQDQAKFPDVLRHVSGPIPASPTRGLLRSPPTIVPTARPDQDEPSPSPLSGRINLDRFRDTDEDDDWFGDGGDTIKVSKSRRPISLITAPTPNREEEKEEPEEAGGGPGQEEDDKGDGREEPDDDEGEEEGCGPARGDDDFENDFELPPGGKLNLAARRDAPKTPSSQQEDFDWGEGSLGTRHAGTRRSGRSNRSSSASALSPSLSSTITFESEDETFDDLVLPNGPVDFKERLNRRKITDSPDRIPDDLESDSPKKVSTAEADRDDFLEHLDLGEGEIFDCKKLTNHRNLKLKDTRPPSPMRPKTAVTLTFTNKPVTQSRLPRPNHDRTQPSLEPVLESGGSTLKRARRPQSRLGGGGGGGGHSAQSSISSTGVPTPSTPSPVQSLPPSTPRRKDGGAAEPSGNALRNGPTTTNAQLLRLKRSLPAMRPPNSPAKAMSSIASRFDRPPSRGDRPPASSIRPRTPVDRRVVAETSTAAAAAAAAAANATALQTRKSHHTLVPACPSHNQPHLGPAKTRTLRRQDSEHSIELRPRSRTVSRSTTRSPSPRRPPHQPHQQQQQQKNDDLWARLSRPKKPKQLFDGHELDGFDDLPTSMQAESKFMKAALNAGGVKSPMRIRSKQLLPNSTTSPGPYTPMRSETLPHFARDTATSRIAREQSLISLAQRAPLQTTQAPIGPLNPHHRAPPRGHHHNHSNSQSTIRPRLRKPHEPPKKPSLISNLNMSKGPKTVNGMSYNPATFRWEGNENALNVFDAPAPSPMAPPATPLVREKETTTPRPALITNRTAVKGVQVVGGMVFDPQNMCWLKLDPKQQQQQQQDKPPAASTATTATTFDSHDEDDVFKDIPDLEDKPASSTDGGGGGGACSRASDVKDDWLVGEEFDVGPEFIRRQREEEKKWRRKCGGWVGRERDRDAWRWTIRELVTQ